MKTKVFMVLLSVWLTSGSMPHLQWSFNEDGNSEGWQLRHALSGTVAGGYLNLEITGADPYMVFEETPIEASGFNRLHVKMKNNTPDTVADLFFVRSDAPGQHHMIRFDIVPEDSLFREYEIDLDAYPEWRGTIVLLRLDPVSNVDSGTLEIDLIRLSKGEATETELSLENSTLKVKLDLTRGGAIKYISFANTDRNLINIHDEGRYIQQSYYAGNSLDRTAEGQSPSWSPWPWNPIQVGDAFRHRAQILEARKDGDTLYVKNIPMLWDMNNEPAEATMEQWLSLDGNVLEVRNKLTCFRTDDLYGENILRDQELPAVYPISALENLHCYIGDQPFTGAASTNLPVVNLSSGFWGIYPEVSENWMAFVDGSTNGVGVYNTNCVSFLAGMAGSPGHEATDGSTSYIAPVKKEALSKNSVYEYTYHIIVGSVEEIRSKVYELRDSQ